MLDCWNYDPNLRPSPNDIVAHLTPPDSIFDDADSELNGGQQICHKDTPTKDTPNDTAGHQSCEIPLGYYHGNMLSLPLPAQE